jgi:hypothetical protein
MNEPARISPTEDPKHHDGHVHTATRHRRQTLLLIAFAFVITAAAVFLHAGFLVAALGALGILVLAVTKIFRFQAALFPSLVCLLLMIMLNLWHWADRYFIALYTGNLAADRALLQQGAAEAMLVLASVWAYRRLMKLLDMHITQNWFVRRSFLDFLDGIFFLQLFLLCFWLSGFLLNRDAPGGNSDDHAVTRVAGIMAAFVSGIIFVVYFIRKKNARKKHRHH